uniref:Putative secreted protein n=1 Tax=Anopheles darlingi TaxID=43151 RepID=A0A2M4DCF2_ANODA
MLLVVAFANFGTLLLAMFLVFFSRLLSTAPVAVADDNSSSSIWEKKTGTTTRTRSLVLIVWFLLSSPLPRFYRVDVSTIYILRVGWPRDRATAVSMHNPEPGNDADPGIRVGAA